MAMDAASGKVWDIIIIGGGLGGLSLAVELSAPEFAHLSVLVLEKRTSYTRDRTWSYWTDQPHRYSHLERQRWNHWSVSLQGVQHSHSSAQVAYATLDADAFYQAALQTMATAEHIELRLDCAVTAIDTTISSTTTTATATVTLQGAQVLCARTVLDARPAGLHQPGALVQQFVGWEVTTQSDVFDAQSVQLMAFEPHARGLHFWYVLPYNARCALVESTWVSPADWQPDYNTEMRTYLAQLCHGQDYSVAYREQGVLQLDAPAQLEPVPVNSAPVKSAPVGLGRNGGTLRASTGYAFLDTIAHAAQLARSLAVHLQSGGAAVWQPQPFQRPATDAWMDSVFLQVLANDWHTAPDYFMQIFKTLSSQDTVAFLTGQATRMQKLAVMRALPVRPFASAALTRMWGA
jgi:lycopene beta-cyclase